MKQEIQIFRNAMFGIIRTMADENGQPWFVGKDVADALGYKKPQNALSIHVDGEDKTTALIQGTGSNYKTQAIVINESGLYSLILSSKLDTAKQFKHWVTAEVLPQIRLTGGYIPLHDADGHKLTPEEVLERADDIIGATLQIQNEPTEGCLSATEVAKTWGMNVSDFNAVLADMGIQRYAGGRWHLTSKLEGLGLTDERLYVYYSMRGDRRSKIYMVWTPAGVEYLRKTFAN